MDPPPAPAMPQKRGEESPSGLRFLREGWGKGSLAAVRQDRFSRYTVLPLPNMATLFEVTP